MRHLRSIIYALVLAPAVWILCGVGFDQDLTGRARDNGGIESLSGVLLLLLAGAAYSILLFSPISPLGPLLAGLAFVGVGAWARLAPDQYAGIWPPNVVKEGFDVSTPGYGLAVLLAVPMLCTALSARRWKGFEPPEILLIGTIGRARGAAPVAGTPIAAERTTVIPQQRQYQVPPAQSFPPPQSFPQGQPTYGTPAATPFPANGDENTTVVPAQATTVLPQEDDEEKTTVMSLGRPAASAPTSPARPPADEVTTLLTPPGRPHEEPATIAVSSPADDRTEVLTSAHEGSVAGAAAPDEFSNQTTREVADSESTRDVVSDQPTHDVAASENTADVSADEATRDMSADEATRDMSADEVTRDVAGDEATRDVGGDEVTRDVVAEDDEPTRPVIADEARGEETTRDAGAGQVTHDLAGDETTRLAVVPPAPGRYEPHGSGEETTRLVFPAAAEAQGDNDKTEALQLPAATDGERTQLIRSGTVQPPGDRTQLLTFPTPGEAATARNGAADPPGETASRPDEAVTRAATGPGEAATVVNPVGEKTHESTKAMSIVGEERPDPGEDPTTRLSAVRDPGQVTEPRRGAMSATNLERPADEAQDDTRPLTLPAPREATKDS
ncbi:hypothetical protein [Actinoplanes friuliensis]|uniref:hypothetical protein n=1 Tax=Actinoplanes friuliensis TaxID=196914 RepID=UPI000417BDF7|nr:hypothetical protein [Actinoplanes friuliensis]